MPGTRTSRRSLDGSRRALARRYGDALRLADASSAEQVIDEALELGMSAAQVQADLIHPAMTWIGELWQKGAISIADEHLATAVSQRMLMRLFEQLQTAAPRSRERVLLAAVEGQQHVLGLRMVADVLEGAGFDVLYLGADVPTGPLVGFIEQHKPAIAGLSLSFAAGSAALVEAIIAIDDARPETRILLGGEGVATGLRASGYPWLDSSVDVLRVVEGMLAGKPTPLPAAIKALRRSSPEAPESTPIDEEALAAGRFAAVVDSATEEARSYARKALDYRFLAFNDPVTELPNRRAFDDQLLDLAGTASGALLLTLDVDFFKSVNDQHGHATGDEVLRSVGRAIRREVRPSDFVARTGGDEFAAILPGCSAGQGLAVAERIRLRVLRDPGHDVTLSIGIAPLSDNARHAVLAADQALYAAKQGGRDRVAAGRGVESATRA
ncbi:MAG TPA: diguanylate cyclase [Thermoleophilaceae bacterium]|nr:diguanylate cyclase [Thermoleophilaceae bacterium]